MVLVGRPPVWEKEIHGGLKKVNERGEKQADFRGGGGEKGGEFSRKDHKKGVGNGFASNRD